MTTNRRNRRVVLVQFDLVLGARILLNVLRDAGYYAAALQINMRYSEQLSARDLGCIREHIGDATVGLSFNSFYAPQAERLARYLKRKGVRHIVTGGNHATALPVETLAYSDIVVRYEAERTLPRVLQAMRAAADLSAIPGILFRRAGRIVDTGAPEIEHNLDALPWQCVDPRRIKYFRPGGTVVTPRRRELFPHRGAYIILASRGCPFDCTYCSNSLYHSLHPGFRRVRRRSNADVIAEMTAAVVMGFTEFYIGDDNFFGLSLAELRDFGRRYRRAVGRPFSVSGISPAHFRAADAEKKLAALVASGVSDIRIGVQSGSDNTLARFGRSYRAAEVPKLLAPIDRHRRTIWPAPHDKLHVALDFICDAPWETDADRLATIHLARTVLTQNTIFFYTLVYLPGTKLYEQAVARGWLRDRKKDIYHKGIAGVADTVFNRMLFMVAVAKERGVPLSAELIDHLARMVRTNTKLAQQLIDDIISCINGVESHHGVKVTHAALHPYLGGFTVWTKTTGRVGDRVLFRSYHEAYG